MPNNQKSKTDMNSDEYYVGRRVFWLRKGRPKEIVTITDNPKPGVLDRDVDMVMIWIRNVNGSGYKVSINDISPLPNGQL